MTPTWPGRRMANRSRSSPPGSASRTRRPTPTRRSRTASCSSCAMTARTCSSSPTINGKKARPRSSRCGANCRGDRRTASLIGRSGCGVDSSRSIARQIGWVSPEVTMSSRSLALWVTLAALVGGAPPVVGQAGAVAGRMRAADAGPPGIGPDGHPDLQGVWLNNSATPLERPKLLEGRTSLTDEEVAELRRRADRLFKNTNADFAAGDAVYLAALADIDRFKSTTATGSTFEMIEREFDHRTSLVIDPPDGRIPSLTAEARQRRALADATRRHPAEGPEDLNQVERCLTYGVPRLSGNNTGAGPLGYYAIVQTPGYVVLFLEAIHEARIVTLDGRPHLPASMRQWQGDSRGRWDGQTL